MTNVFVSYSHRDETLRNELQKHLSPMKREGLIDAWDDWRIDAGDELNRSISQKLENADVVLLLVSPDFLASNYCFDIEMRRALERHAAGEARVIPVILQPCDWQSTPLGQLKAVPTDGKPIMKFPNINDGFMDVVKAIRKVVPSKAATPSPKIGGTTARVAPPAAQLTSHIRSSNLMVKKSFSDHDRDRFLEDAFEYIATYFEGSLTELEKRNPEITTRYKRIDSDRFTAFIYRNGSAVSECAVFLGKVLGNQIAYSSDSNSTNGMNDSLSIVDDGTAMFLKSMLGAAMGGTKTGNLTLEGAAESFWSSLIRRVQS